MGNHMAARGGLFLNPFFLISQFAFWANLLFFAVLSRRSRTRVGRVSSLLILCFGLWALGDSMMRVSTNPEMAGFWNSLSGVGWCFAPSLYLQTALLSAKKRRRWSFLYLPSLTFLLLLWFSPHINSGVMLARWGYAAVLGQWLWTYLLYSTLLFISGVVLLLRSPRAILKYLGLTTLVMLILGSTTDLVLPYFGVHFELFPVFTVPISFAIFLVCALSEGDT